MKRHTSLAITCFVASAFLQGCVSTKVRVFETDDKGEVTKETNDVGFQFREALPYLLVTSEVVTSQATALYIYDGKYGFLPVCDQPVTDDASLKARNDCLAFRDKIKNASQVKPAATLAPTSSRDAILRDDAGVVLVSQRLQTQLVAALAPDTKPAHSPNAAVTTLATQADMDAKIKSELAAAKPEKAGAVKKTAEAVAKGTDGGTDTTSKTDSTTPDAQPKGGDTTQQGAIQIVYLPSPCRVYAVTQTNFLSTAKLNLALTNGWQLSTVGVETDSTAVIGKLLDTVGTVVGATKGGTAGGGTKGGGGGATAQALAEDLYARTETQYLAPGLYPLATCRPKGDGFKLVTPLNIPTVSKVEWAIAFPKSAN